ncbi:tetratricopeptide repeat protein [bacterium]|jgi:tetratricopeptide (TPR) repeat protein|nr:tetratricopeptide repeat protein [bacterium]
MVQSRTDSAKDPSHRKIQDLLSRKKFTEAEALIREKLQKNPEDAEPHYLLGIMYYFQGQIGLTVENLKKSLSLDPKHTDAAVCLSVLYNDIGKYDEAKKVFEQANQSVIHYRLGDDLNIDKKFSVKHLELADLYFRYRRYDEAIEEYSKAARLDPAATEIRIRRAKAYAKKGFLTRSLQELQQLKHESPQDIPTRIQLGLLHYSQGNLLDAELEWENVLVIDPQHKEAQAYIQMAQKNRVKL